ncbi:MAG: GDP-mannose 4,6-dehydratase [Desulfitobacteriaceae bacterium]
MSEQKRALVFGISGQDGAYLSQLLLSKGYEVHGTSRDAETTNFYRLDLLGIREKIHLHSAAINDFRSTLHVINKVIPHEIYNLTGQSSVGLSFEQPFETLESISTGTLNILEAIRFLAVPIRFYNAGSGECFGDNGGIICNENTPMRPVSPYGVAKAAAFWITRNYREAYGLFACSGILFNHESPLRPKRFVTRKITSTVAQIVRGEPITLRLGNVEIKRDWGWAPEYVEAMWLMLQQEQPEDFIIATGRVHSLLEFVQAAFRCLNLDWERYTVIDTGLLRPKENLISFGDPSKANTKLGWSARTMLDGVVQKMMDADLGQGESKDV